MAGLFDQLIMQLMQAQPMGLLGNMGIQDQPQSNQQFAANLPTQSGIDMNAMRKLEELRRQLGVQANTPGGKDTDAALKAIEEALRYAPK